MIRSVSTHPPLQILYEETLFQASSTGKPLVGELQSRGVLLGIKVRRLPGGGWERGEVRCLVVVIACL